MKTEQWNDLNEIFHNVLKLPESERKEYIEKKCGNDEALKREVWGLVDSAESETDFLKNDAVESIESKDRVTNDFEGKRIGQYQIIKEIGRGGMGAVFLAERADREFDQKVALKVVHSQFYNESLVEKFKNERQILASLKHPNISQLIDGGTTEEGLPYFVMEYVEGETLLNYCDKNRLSTGERLSIFKKICSAVSHAHKNLIIHRDIKPSNVIVTKDGIPKLLDFGIAKPYTLEDSEESVTLTKTGGRMLTPDFASPEQISGAFVTTSTDVYSLGVVLYELLTGHRPFHLSNLNPLESYKIICEKEPQKPSSIVEETADLAETKKVTPQTVSENRNTQPENLVRMLAGDVDNILLKALRKEPERRYATVNEFADDVKRYQEGLPVSATADSKTYRIKKFIQRHKAGTLMAAFATFLLISATAITGYQYFQAQKAQAEAEQRFNDVRKLANSIVFELHDQIKDLPGSTPAREKLITRASEYLDKLAASNSEDPTLLLELANAYEKIGDIQGGMFEANLGKRELAFKSYNKSLEIGERLIERQPDNTEFRGKLADSYFKIANMRWIQLKIPESVSLYEKSLNIRKKLFDENPEDKLSAIELARVYSRYGYAVAAGGEIDKGLVPMRKSTELMETLKAKRPDDEKVLDMYALSYDLLAAILDGGKQKYAEALETYKKTHPILEKLYKNNPQNAQYKRNYSLGYYNIALVQEKLDKNEEGLKNAEKAVEISREILESDPKSVEFKQNLASFEILYVDLLTKTGKTDMALASLNSVMETFKKMAKSAPKDEIIQFRIANVNEEYGKIYLALAEKNNGKNDWQAARDHFRKSHAIYKRLKDEGKATGDDAAKAEEMEKLVEKCEKALSA